MTLRSRFHDARLQAHYKRCRRHGDPSHSFWAEDGISHWRAYESGRAGDKSCWPMTTFAHASCAAGQDDRRAQLRAMAREIGEKLETVVGP